MTFNRIYQLWWVINEQNHAAIIAVAKSCMTLFSSSYCVTVKHTITKDDHDDNDIWKARYATIYCISYHGYVPEIQT